MSFYRQQHRIKQLASMLVSCVLLVCCAIAQALEIRVENGARIDAPALNNIVAQSHPVGVIVNGSGSEFDAPQLQTFITSSQIGETSGVTLTNGGELIASPAGLDLAGPMVLFASPNATLSTGSLTLGTFSELLAGTIQGDLVNGGMVNPGGLGNDTPSQVTVLGNYTQTAGGLLQINFVPDESGGIFSSFIPAFDVLSVQGAASLDGNLEILQADGQTVPVAEIAGDSLPVVSASSISGNFDAIANSELAPSGELLGLYNPAAFELQFVEAAIPDTMGPSIDALTIAGLDLSNPVTAPAELLAVLSDASGIAVVDFAIDGSLVNSDNSAPYNVYIPADLLDDGIHQLAITARDVFGNTTNGLFEFTVDLAAPPAPVITIPEDGITTSLASQGVLGTSVPGSSIRMTVNGQQLQGEVLASETGGFGASVLLNDGENTISAIAVNRRGQSGPSNVVTVTLSDQLENGPGDLVADAREAGVIRLAWEAVNNATGYDLYRSDSSFTDPSLVSKVNSSPLSLLSFDDVPPDDGGWYYRAVAIFSNGSASAPSIQAFAQSDATPPTLLSISYQPNGAYDAATDTYGQGVVLLDVLLNEPLLTTPFLSFAGASGVPVAVDLDRDDSSDTRYTGILRLTEVQTSSELTALFSARDFAGNRGTTVETGGTINIDTQGPQATLSVTPASPVNNDSPADISIALTLNEAFLANESLLPGITTPLLDWSLSSDPENPTPIALIQDGSNSLLYTGSFTLPDTAAADAAETLSFGFASLDVLGNLGEDLGGDTQLQVYQGELPPLEPPNGLQATVLPGGLIRLQWLAVDDAADYAVLLQAPPESGLSEVTRSGNTLSVEVPTAVDGEYAAAVASVRLANGQESISGPSDTVTVNTDSLAPPTPTGFVAALTGSGVQTEWEAVDNAGASVAYRLYRGPIDTETNPANLNQLTEVDLNEALDDAPVSEQPYYYLSSVDEVGNESALTQSVFVDAELFPVRDLIVRRIEEQPPVVSWSHGGGASVAGFNVSLGESIAGQLLTQAPIIDTEYTHNGYDDRSRKYGVEPVDATDNAGPQRVVLLPEIALIPVLEDGEPFSLRQGEFTALQYNLQNLSNQRIDQAFILWSIEGDDYLSQVESLESEQSKPFSIVVPGKSSYGAWPAFSKTVSLGADTGEVAELVSMGNIDVLDARPSLSLQTRDMLRGGEGEVQFSLSNYSDVPVEIVLASNNLNAPSDEVRFKLQDGNGNVLAVASPQQTFGADLRTVGSTGQTVVTIPAGATFNSDWIGINVPSASPDDVQLTIEIDQLHYRLGEPDNASVDGQTAVVQTSLVDTPYTATIDSVVPQMSNGDEPVVIQGQAINRVSGEPEPFALVDLIFSNGFERQFSAITDADGLYSFNYQPLSSEAGRTAISAIHPDLNERPEQSELFVGRVLVEQTQFSFNQPIDVTQLASVKVSTTPNQTATNLQLQYLAEDQLQDTFPPGVSIGLGDPVNLTEQQSVELTFDFSSSSTPDLEGVIQLRVVADEIPEPIAFINVNYKVSEAVPFLNIAPSFEEAGIVRGNSGSIEFTLSNIGFAPAEDLAVTLIDGTGAVPDWVSLTSPATISSLPVGGEEVLKVFFAPGAGVSEGIYEFAVRASNDTLDVTAPVRISVVQDGFGSVLIKMSDLFTATFDENANLIPGLQGATVELQNELVPTINVIGLSDDQGEILFEMQAGTYLFRATGPKHRARSGRLVVEPGLVKTFEIFLEYETITIEWSVNEITIEDIYEITLEAKFEADVPGAVVVIEPPSVQLPEMVVGETFHGEFTVTNYGLVRADNVEQNFPVGDEFYRFEFFADLPNELAASQRVTVPYKVMKIGDPTDTQTGGQTARACPQYGAIVLCDFVCANGQLQRVCGSEWKALPDPYDCPGTPRGGSFGVLDAIGGGGGGGRLPNVEPLPSENPCDDCENPPPTCKNVCESPECDLLGWNCEADPGRNDLVCGAPTTEDFCKTCVDGKCRAPKDLCGDLPKPMIDEGNVGTDGARRVLKTVQKLARLFSLGSIDVAIPSINASGKIEQGVECCDSCEGLTGAYTELEGKVEGKKAKLVLSTPKKFGTKISLDLGVQKLIARAGASASGAISASAAAGSKAKTTACEDEDCFEAFASISGSGKLSGFGSLGEVEIIFTDIWQSTCMSSSTGSPGYTGNGANSGCFRPYNGVSLPTGSGQCDTSFSINVKGNPSSLFGLGRECTSNSCDYSFGGVGCKIEFRFQALLGDDDYFALASAGNVGSINRSVPIQILKSASGQCLDSIF